MASKYLTTALVLIVFLLLVGLGYFAYQNQKLVAEFAKQTEPTPTLTPSPSPQIAPSPTPSPKLSLSALQENIKDGINSGNTQALASFMTDPVNVILQATECCGPKSPAEAVSQLAYIKEGTPFDFSENSATVIALKNKNPELSDKFIGISKSGEHLVAFGINPDNRITDIRMAVSWKLFSY